MGNRMYNGFTWSQRCAVIPDQKVGVADGRIYLPDPKICCITFEQTHNLELHLEDYTDPFDAYPMCRRAHGMVHKRFWYPEEWFAFVYQNYQHGAWFTFLTMDRASLARPFHETYPNGVPPVSHLDIERADKMGITRESFLPLLLRDGRGHVTTRAVEATAAQSENQGRVRRYATPRPHSRARARTLGTP